MEDGGNVHVTDEVVVLIWSGSDFDSSNKNVLEHSGFPIGLDGGEELPQVSISLDIKSGVPLAVFVKKRDGGGIGELGVDIPGVWIDVLGAHQNEK